MSYVCVRRRTVVGPMIARVLVVILVCVLSCVCSTSWAQGGADSGNDWLPPVTAADATTVNDTPQPSVAGSSVRPVSMADLLGKLALVVVLIYGATWGLKQWRERAIVTPSSGRGGLIRVRESVALGTSGHLYVVEFGSRNLLVSAVGDQVTLLTANSSSEMSAFDTSSIPVQEIVEEEQPPAEPVEGLFQQRMRDVNGARLRAENFRRTADWERKRDALVRALQESARSQAS